MDRQADGESAALTSYIFSFKATLMGMNDIPGNAQTQPHSLRETRALISPVEWREDVLQVIFAQARPGILDTDDNLSFVSGCFD